MTYLGFTRYWNEFTDYLLGAMGEGGGFDFLCGAVVQSGHDDQDTVGAIGARFRHLIGVVDEILA